MTTIEQWRKVLAPAREAAWPAQSWVIQCGGAWTHLDTDRRAVRWDLAAVGSAVLRALGCDVPPTRDSWGLPRRGWLPPSLAGQKGPVTLRPADESERELFAGRGVTRRWVAS